MSDVRELSRFGERPHRSRHRRRAAAWGRATAHVFATEGASVAVTDLSADATQAVANEIADRGGTARAWDARCRQGG